jgi:hypothetical protein
MAQLVVDGDSFVTKSPFERFGKNVVPHERELAGPPLEKFLVAGCVRPACGGGTGFLVTSWRRNVQNTLQSLLTSSTRYDMENPEFDENFQTGPRYIHYGLSTFRWS